MDNAVQQWFSTGVLQNIRVPRKHRPKS